MCLETTLQKVMQVKDGSVHSGNSHRRRCDRTLQKSSQEKDMTVSIRKERKTWSRIQQKLTQEENAIAGLSWRSWHKKKRRYHTLQKKASGPMIIRHCSSADIKAPSSSPEVGLVYVFARQLALILTPSFVKPFSGCRLHFLRVHHFFKH